MDDESAPYLILHGLTAVYMEKYEKWIRLDARGNKPGINAQFSIQDEKLAFPVRSELGEKDVPIIFPVPDKNVISALTNSKDFPMQTAPCRGARFTFEESPCSKTKLACADNGNLIFRITLLPEAKGAAQKKEASLFMPSMYNRERGNRMDYHIREMKPCERPMLRDFLYEAIFVPEGGAPPPKSILNSPELQVYIAEFGSKPHDRALVAEVDGKAVGAVWVRIMDDYGHIDNQTPSFAIALYPEYRGFGIGKALMRQMLLDLKMSGCRKASLAVQKANYAVNMYQRVGFEICGENEQEYIMLCELANYAKLEYERE